ncbi:MAG: sugar kinase [Pseudomonadota bacterium]
MTAPDLICMGEPLVEFVRITGSGADHYACGIGGDTSNAAIAAARQGASVGYLTALGTDRFGDRITACWDAESIDHSHTRRDAAAPTGIYFVEPDPAGRSFTYYRAGSAAACLNAADVPLDYIRAARALHLSGITLAISGSMRAAASRAAKEAAAAGVAVSVDTNLRLRLWSIEEARAVTHAAMAHAHIAITSIDDSADLTGLHDPGEIIDFYQALGPEIVLVTKGAEGCEIGWGDQRAVIPAVPCEPVDSTGAGDSFAGAFLARWLETADPLAAGHYAAVVAARVVSGYGAIATIPRREDVLAALRA